MAHAFLPMVPNVTMLIGTLTAEEINKVLGIKEDLKKLKRQFERMLDMIREAEQMNNQDAKTKHWLKQLRDDVYKTDDILDLCRIEAERRKAIQSAVMLERHIKSLLGFCKGIYVNCRVSRSIRKLNLDIEKISRESSLLQERYSAMRNELIASLCGTTPYDEPNIVGKCEDDSKTIVKLLTEGSRFPQKKTEDKLSTPLLAIVGTVGIGKTTLARLIFRSKDLSDAFTPRLWVCVGKDADYLAVLKRIVTYGGGNSMGLDTREKLESKLESKIGGMKFLLVLDDVWDETIWENLLENLLHCGADGSTVLVTTRHKQVARRMGAFHIHHVKRLSDEDGWKLLSRRARLDEGGENLVMEGLGKKIADKCDGLPLVIRAVGSVLRCQEPTRNCWQQVCSNIFGVLPEDVKGLVRLSYVDLPSALKKCFLYCSLFPAETFVIQKRYITQQWVSEGFIEVKDRFKLEEVAEEYYRELIARSLLEPALGLEGEAGAKIPNIFRSLAEELSRDENFSRDFDQMGRDLDSTNNPFEPRRLTLKIKDEPIIPGNLWKLRHLRTMLVFENHSLVVDDSFLLPTFRKLKLLRVLDLHDTRIDQVPDALGNLVHLRYLNLSKTEVNEIPRSIRNLRLLQFLLLNDCKNLRYLSRSIEHLQNLRCLELSGPNNLCAQKMKFRTLRELNCLRGFLVKDTHSTNHADGWPLKELSSLSTLTSLQILRPERATPVEASESKLTNNENLQELELCCLNSREGHQDQQVIKDIFDKFCPAPRVVFLKLKKYYGEVHPSWISKDHLPNLQSLQLHNCSCKTLPPLGELPLLRSLIVKNLRELCEIGMELRGELEGQNAAFPKLERLEFHSLDKLKSWSTLEDKDLPCIQQFLFTKCFKLASIPDLIWRLHEEGRANLYYPDCPTLENPTAQPAPPNRINAIPEVPALPRNSLWQLFRRTSQI